MGVEREGEKERERESYKIIVYNNGVVKSFAS